MKRKLLLFLIVSLAFFLAGILPTPASASLIIPLDFEYSGATPPEGSTPWLTATFVDGDFVDVDGLGYDASVKLTLDASDLQDDEFVTQWVFNFETTNPSLDLSDLEFYHSSGPLDNFIGRTEDFYNAGPAHGFDIIFDFPEAEAFRFNAGDTAVYYIGPAAPGPGPIFADDFDADNSSGMGPFTSAAHVQGIGTNGEGSGWIAPNPVPEPATMLLVGIGLVGLAGFGRRRFKA